MLAACPMAESVGVGNGFCAGNLTGCPSTNRFKPASQEQQKGCDGQDADRFTDPPIKNGGRMSPRGMPLLKAELVTESTASSAETKTVVQTNQAHPAIFAVAIDANSFAQERRGQAIDQRYDECHKKSKKGD